MPHGPEPAPRGQRGSLLVQEILELLAGAGGDDENADKAITLPQTACILSVVCGDAVTLRAAFVALVMCALPALADRVSDDATLAAARREHENRPGMEADALAASHGRAERHGNILTLALSRGTPVALTSNSAACANDDAVNCERFTLVADLKSRHAYLVAKSGYEGCADNLLIDDRSGRQTMFGDVPVFSPDDQRLLIQNECEADEHHNHFEIWRRQGDVWILEWAYTDREAYAADPALKSVYHTDGVDWRDDRITLAFSTHEMLGAPARHWTGTLTRMPDGWHLWASPPKAN